MDPLLWYLLLGNWLSSLGWVVRMFRPGWGDLKVQNMNARQSPFTFYFHILQVQSVRGRG